MTGEEVVRRLVQFLLSHVLAKMLALVSAFVK